MCALPEHGFDTNEFQARLIRAQKMMQHHNLDALFLTTEPEIRYFTGFLTRFWESPTRPWYCIIPVDAKPVAIIPAIGNHLMKQSWLEDTRTWDAPDYEDDGIGLLADAIQELCPKGGRIGTRHDMESHLRMPLGDWAKLQRQVQDCVFVTDYHILRDLR
ncbi:MAG: aminopeptidase P family N-terminal domain-containing protein, partial [Pseudomonadota bacterium]